MVPENLPKSAEKEILRNQYIAVAAMLILFFASVVVAALVFGNDMVKMIRAVIPFADLPLLFIGISSIQNKVSILRPRGKRSHSTGKQAVKVGVLAIIAFVLNLLLVFSPILPFFFEAMTGAS